MAYAAASDCENVYGDEALAEILPLASGGTVAIHLVEPLAMASEMVDSFFSEAGYETPLPATLATDNAQLESAVRRATAVLALEQAFAGVSGQSEGYKATLVATYKWLQRLPKNLGGLTRSPGESGRTFGAAAAADAKPAITSEWHRNMRRRIAF